MEKNIQYNVGIYCRLSKDDEQKTESTSIGTQRSLLTDYCLDNGYNIRKVYVDDGYSGLNFDRPGFNALLNDIDSGDINMVITKDLSRLGRDYIMTGYYSELFFPAHGVRYVAVSDDFDSLKDNNDIAPFKNILNDMYAKDISRKIKTAKRQRAKEGLFINAMAPYGYMKDPKNKNQLIIDPPAAEVVRLIYALAQRGYGSKRIAAELRSREFPAPAAYAHQNGETRFANCRCILQDEPYLWGCSAVENILKNRVYIGELIFLKRERISYKSKRTVLVPEDSRIIVPNAHEPIITQEEFERVHEIISKRFCPAKQSRENIFRGLLYCSSCGHPLSIAHKKLLYSEDDVYRCMYHQNHPEVCRETHYIYHKMLYDYVLSQIQKFSKSVRRQKLNLPIAKYHNVDKLTPEILNAVIERIEVGHVTKKSKPGNVIRIYWRVK